MLRSHFSIKIATTTSDLATFTAPPTRPRLLGTSSSSASQVSPHTKSFFFKKNLGRKKAVEQRSRLGLGRHCPAALASATDGFGVGRGGDNWPPPRGRRAGGGGGEGAAVAGAGDGAGDHGERDPRRALCLITHKLNLTVGIIPSLNVAAGLLGYFLVRTWTAALEKLGIVSKPFTKQENTVIQTCVVACYGLAFSALFSRLGLVADRCCMQFYVLLLYRFYISSVSWGKKCCLLVCCFKNFLLRLFMWVLAQRVMGSDKAVKQTERLAVQVLQLVLVS
ncbi:hypothetical protein GUJ93_ZPchr0012g20343 [Zizania palustris]|uniref:Uncharacterized protein n=1 Tax=Zizania palustris TaxID=103762 RepID=A0A8J5WPF7_ZIZPA|nr:hypothetical protein GUJ93_ZPchr0012g20343 [Zizania palustris]